MSRLARSLWLLGLAVLAAGSVAAAAGARINVSGSIPLGLYWVSKSALIRQNYVVFCPPKSAVFDDALRRGYIGAGFCAGGYGYVMKRLVAMAGDAVLFEDEGVRVNGSLLPCSAPKVADQTGRPLPQMRGPARLGDHQVLLMSDGNAEAFDARYFGLLEDEQIQAVIEPIFTWSAGGEGDAAVHC